MTCAHTRTIWKQQLMLLCTFIENLSTLTTKLCLPLKKLTLQIGKQLELLRLRPDLFYGHIEKVRLLI